MSQSTRQELDTDFQVVPSKEEISASPNDGISISSSPSNSLDSLNGHNDNVNGKTDTSNSAAELPPIEWHPHALAFFGFIKRLATPVCRVVFAPKAQRTMIKSAITIVVFVWILLTSIAAYLTFYHHYVPQTLHSQPIFFQYGHIDQRNQVAPKGIIDLTGGYQKVPLRHEQAYNVFVQLHVPNSNINFDLGNFMVNVELLSTDNAVISQSSRAGILRYQSHAQRLLHVLSKALPLLAGLTEESQVINIPLIEDFMEQKSNPVVQAAVTLSNPALQIYDAHFSIRADFRGLRYYMYHRRIPTAVTFIVIFMLIELMCATVAWKSFGQNLWFSIRDLFEVEEVATLDQQQQQGLESPHETVKGTTTK
ncbi:hypothetical protein [Absidia glauca]|uniref:Seipin n=1 Tax=Absidia glauca TaxID=4829 RepID=A0A163IZQ7_ABSGL|nr:hypothetical protein [Absidia glauca]